MPACCLSICGGQALLLPLVSVMRHDSCHATHMAPCLPPPQRALPALAVLIVDPSLKVREALATLLVAVSASRSLHFYDVVALPQLLDVMAHDAPPVARRIHQILLPSYFPNVQEGAVSECAAARLHDWPLSQHCPRPCHGSHHAGCFVGHSLYLQS